MHTKFGRLTTVLALSLMLAAVTAPGCGSEDDGCSPNCQGLECGNDGCGGTCGSCTAGRPVCEEGLCVPACEPMCVGMECGDNQCGGSCGECGGANHCVAGQCEPLCPPECEGKTCGDDGCGGTCGECDDNQECIADGTCACVAQSAACGEACCDAGSICHEEACCAPTCEGKNCGDDGCGGSCGECGGPQDECVEGQCTCQPQCDGLECGTDGCGGSCGECAGPQDKCVEGLCVCQPLCLKNGCGDDGCAGNCGECAGPQDACVEGLCVCQPACASMECGDDGCDGVCGECANCGDECVEGMCIYTACDGLDCGDDGCGALCGECMEAAICVEGSCCAPTCEEKQCGSDGCIDTCGNGIAETGGCLALQACDEETFTCGAIPFPDCEDIQCGPGVAGGGCGTCPCPECSDELTKCEAGQCVEFPGLDCEETLDCLGTCAGESVCQQACLGDSSQEGGMTYNTLINCLSDEGYFDCFDNFPDDTPEQDACLEENFESCLGEWYACIAGDLPCVDLYICLIGCPGGDAGKTCSSDCFGSSTVEALMVWDNFIACLDLHGYFDCLTGDSACYDEAWEACDTEFETCAQGQLTCGEILGCRTACGAFDQLCNISCLVHGTLDAQHALDDIAACVEEVCDPVTGTCEKEVMLSECFDTYAACVTQ